MEFPAEAEKQTDSDFMLFFTDSPAKRKPEKDLMLKNKVLPSLKIYLFFAIVSLSVSAGCLDIDFGGGDGSGNVESDEKIMGSVREVIPSVDGGISDLFVRFTNDDQEEYSGSTDSRGDFSLTGNLAPRGELEVFETESADSNLGSRRFTVFPGATLNIGDIRVRKGAPLELMEDVRVTFRGRISDKNCDNERGTLNVEIEGRNADVLVQVTTATDIDIRTIEEPGCDEIVDGDKVRIDGVLEGSENVRATSIDVE